MLLKRVLAYYIDMIIRAILCIMLFITMFFYSKVLTAKLNYEFIGILIMIFIFFAGFFIDYLICLRNGGFTIGDDLLHIRIISKKYDGKKFYFLRFIFRTISICIPIFLIYNFVIMLITKQYDYVWYDNFLGIYCEKKYN